MKRGCPLYTAREQGTDRRVKSIRFIGKQGPRRLFFPKSGVLMDDRCRYYTTLRCEIKAVSLCFSFFFSVIFGFFSQRDGKTSAPRGFRGTLAGSMHEIQIVPVVRIKFPSSFAAKVTLPPSAAGLATRATLRVSSFQR